VQRGRKLRFKEFPQVRSLFYCALDTLNWIVRPAEWADRHSIWAWLSGIPLRDLGAVLIRCAPLLGAHWGRMDRVPVDAVS
jgi:hypothetical protein